MNGDVRAIEYLNNILGNELIAINQYFLHSKMYQHWGFTKLAVIAKKDSMDEMKHADALAARILTLDGLPNFQKLGKLSIGQTAQEALTCDLQLEQQAMPALKEAISYLESVQDFASRSLLNKILAEEEDHAEWLATQLDLINTIGLENYLQQQV